MNESGDRGAESDEGVKIHSGEFERLLEKSSPITAVFPFHAQSQEVYSEIRTQAIRWGLIEEASAEWGLISLLPDHNVGLYALSRLLRVDSEENEDERLATLYRIGDQHPETRVAQAALAEELGILAEEDPAEFKKRCSILLKDESESNQRISLYRKAVYHDRVGETTETLRAYAKFLNQFLETAMAMGLVHRVATLLSENGYHAEASALRRFPGQSRSVIAFLLEDNPPPPTQTERAISAGGRLVAAIIDLDLPRVVLESEKFVTATEAILQEQEIPHRTDWRRFALICDSVVAEASQLLFIETGRKIAYARPNAEGLTIQSPICQDTLTNLLAVNTDALERFEIVFQEESAFDLFENYEKLLRHLMLRRQGHKLIDHFEKFHTGLVDDSRTPALMLEVGKHFADSMGTPSKAIDVFDTIIHRYSMREEALNAWLLKAILLYERERFEECYEVALDFMVQYPEDPRVPNALFLLAVTESALGLEDEAKQRMERLVLEYPASEVSARGLFWLGSVHLSKQEYDRSREYFQDLIDRYPHSSYRKKCEEYLSRLEVVGK